MGSSHRSASTGSRAVGPNGNAATEGDARDLGGEPGGAPRDDPGPIDSLRRLLTRRFGDREWDLVLRATGVLALIGIPVSLWLRGAGPLIGFTLVTVWVNGPLSPVFPATYEPILMIFGRVYSPVLVAAVGTAGILYVEYVNFRLHARVLRTDALESVRESWAVEKVVDLFDRAPVLTIWLCSWSILPYWPLRIIAPVAGYPVKKVLAVTLFGRFPRLWLFAALGGWWGIDTKWLLVLTVLTVAVGVGLWLYRRKKGRTRRRLIAAQDRPEPPGE